MGFSAKRIHGGSEQNGAIFRSHKNSLYLLPGADENHKRFRRPSDLIGTSLLRIDALPEVCEPPTPNTPLGNFEVFAQTFAENYIGFDLRHLNWENVVAQQRKKLSSETSAQELFNILKTLIEPLTDIHTGIEAPNIRHSFDPRLRSGTDRVVRGNIDRFAKSGRRDLAKITDRLYIPGSLIPFCRGQWQYGVTKRGVGYLRILGFGDYGWRNGFEHDLQALNRALDQILRNSNLRGLVIDLRLSFGGDDRLGLAIAARLTQREYIAYAIQARSDPTVATAFTALEPVWVKRGRSPIFTGPIAELIGPITMSAAETFTQALMGRTPHVTRIGENTQGVFCDSLERHLPNGWIFALPNAVYRTPDNKAFEVIGIPPDIPVPVFAEKDVAIGQDPAMAQALRLLEIRK